MHAVDPLQPLKLLAVAAVALGLPIALVVRHRRVREPVTTQTGLLGASVLLALLGFVVAVQARDLVPTALEPLLHPLLAVGATVDLLIAFGRRRQ